MREPKSRRESDPVTLFVRELIRQWERHSTLKDLSFAAMGGPWSMPSQIKAETSDVTFYSAGLLAGPLGYGDVPGLVNAAYEWWHARGRELPAAVSPLESAIRIAAGYGVTREQVDRVLARCPPADYGGHDALWWLAKFHEERALANERMSVPPASAVRPPMLESGMVAGAKKRRSSRVPRKKAKGG